MKRFFSKCLTAVLALALAVTTFSAPAMAASARASFEAGIPDAIEGRWEYVGSNPDGSAGLPAESVEIWMRGHAYGLTSADEGKSYIGNMLDTKGSAYRSAYETLNGSDPKYDYIRDVRVVVLYLPNCPYSKSLLPQFRYIASEAGVQIMVADVTKYSASLLPYYNCINFGATSPIVIYLDASASVAATGGSLPMGQTAVHTTAAFVDILKKAGYSHVQDLTDGETSSYTKEEAFERAALQETNRVRLANGLIPLATTDKLEQAADIRVREIVTLIAHQRHDGRSYSTVFGEVGINDSPYWSAENIAAGAIATLPENTVTAWMGSPGHRANILKPYLTHISVGYYYQTEDPTHYSDNWIQLFLGRIAAENLLLSQSAIEVIKGVPISDMDIDLVFDSEIGVSSIPLIDEMCTGYDPQSAGEQAVTVHYGEKTLTLLVTVGDIEPVVLTEQMVAFASEEELAGLVYDGRAKTPAVRVSNPTGAYALIEGYSYEVTYDNNINAGTASVTVKGKGNYTGSVTKTFSIRPADISPRQSAGSTRRMNTPANRCSRLRP